MKAGEHERLARLEREYWWHVGRRHILRGVLDAALGRDGTRGVLLDVGCGAGGNFELLAEYGRVVGMDDSPAAMAILRATAAAPAICGSAGNLPVRTGSVDAIALLDVVEHIDDDMAVLRECFRALRPGAPLLISVPAYQWLWSGHDEALGHRRRYTRAGLAARLERAGFTVRTRSYAIFLLFPLIAGYRLVERLLSRRQESSYVMVPRPVNALFASLLWAEAHLIRAGIALPFGTSIIVVAVRPPK